MKKQLNQNQLFTEFGKFLQKSEASIAIGLFHLDEVNDQCGIPTHHVSEELGELITSNIEEIKSFISISHPPICGTVFLSAAGESTSRWDIKIYNWNEITVKIR